MKQIRQLTKENCWDELKKRFPEAMDVFGAWLDEYKIESDYFKLFRNDLLFIEPNNAKVTDRQVVPLKEPPTRPRHPRFHELPGELQFGIFCAFIHDMIDSQRLKIPGLQLSIAYAPKDAEMEWYIIAYKVIEAIQLFIKPKLIIS